MPPSERTEILTVELMINQAFRDKERGHLVTVTDISE